MLANRIRSVLDELLCKNQNGFREKRSTTTQILTLRRIIKGVKQKQLPAVLLFIDFSKAFDSIDRSKMEQILLAYGIPEKVVKGIMMMYSNTQAFVRSPDGDTEYFDINAGVLQGDTLAPYLFIIVLDYVLRILDTHRHLGFTLKEARSRRILEEKVTDADFADDIAVFSNRIRDIEILLNQIEQRAATVGLHI